MPSVEELAVAVTSRDTFLQFVDALAAERERDEAAEAMRPSNPYGPTAMGWQSTTIHDFLNAAVAYARDGNTLPEEPRWRDFALFLLRGKAYE